MVKLSLNVFLLMLYFKFAFPCSLSELQHDWSGGTKHLALFCKDTEPEFTLAGDKSLVLMVRLSWRVASDTADACGRGLSTFFLFSSNENGSSYVYTVYSF